MFQVVSKIRTFCEQKFKLEFEDEHRESPIRIHLRPARADV
jgi:hypothetical protein